MHFESVPTDWFDADALRLPNYKVGRVSYGYGRSYVRMTEEGLESPFRLYTSLTTAINKCAPMEKPLLEWYMKHGQAEADRLLTMSQHYGTLMHLLVGKFLMDKFVDLNTISESVDEYLSSKSYWEPECKDWHKKLKYDLLAFAQFALDNKIKPLGIEYVLLSEKYGFGTLIDLVCEMTIEEKGFFGETYKSGDKKDQPKESKRDKKIRAIVNFKSGRHGFYRSNGIQMQCEKLLWEENFPELPLEAAYNWSPKEWESSPGYNMKDWSNEVFIEEVEAIMKLAQIRFGDSALNKKYISIEGMLYSGHSPSECIKIIGVEEFCKQKFTIELS